MTRHSLIKTLMVLFAVLFLSAQSLSQAHAAANGGVDHTHDGVSCEVALVAAQHINVEPALIITTPEPQITPRIVYAPLIQAAPIGFQTRAPPPRGPPAHR